MSTTETTTPTETVHTWDLPDYNLDAFRTRIDQANRRLHQAGSTQRFEVEYKPYTVETTEVDPAAPGLQTTYHEQRWVATLTGPLYIRSERYEFAATLVAEEAGFTVHSAPGVELGGFRPRGDNECEHCNTVRNRSRLYLVREMETGELTQVGHTCLELYTGIQPHGLWVLELADDLDEVASLGPIGDSGRRLAEVAIDDVLRWAWGYSNGGKAYVSAANSQERMVPSTGSKVRQALYLPPRPNPRDNRDFERYVEAGQIAASLDEDTLSAIRGAVETVEADSDYGQNLRVILASPTGVVGFRNVAIVASLVAIYARNLEREQERQVRAARPKSSGFLGEVGERVRNFEVNLGVVREWEGDYGWTTLLIGSTPAGQAVKWFRSGRHDLDAGDVMRLKAATVKAHEEFNGDDVTVITRGLIAQ